MEKVTFTCETITPMFMYGADGKTPELRVASIKGVMRFWWRAINGNSNIKALKDAESEIFGSTDRRSKVNIRIRHNGKPIEIEAKKIKEQFKYLFFSIDMENEKEKKCFINLKFEVILSSRDEKALQEACYSFILLSLFGGLGSRSRRGGGSFVITDISEINYNQFLLKGNNRSEVEDSIKDIYKNIINYFNEIYKGKEATSQYSNLSDLNFKLSNNKKSWNEVLKDIDKEYSKFRKKKENKLLKNASFGLPIIFEDKSDSKKSIEVVTNPEFERRASPMIIKILKVQENYFWLVLKLNGEFLPKGTKIKEKKDTSYKDIYENIIDDFMESLR